MQLFDEVETLRGDGKRFDALVTVLNVGFERGGVVTRLEHRGEAYVDEPYEVFAPRVLAGIDGLKDTLEDRSLSVFMLRKRRAEPVSPIGRATDADAVRLRAQCALACLTHIGAIVAAYERAPDVLEREGIDDRAVDLWSPLLALAKVADAEDRGHRVADVLAAARTLGALRDADAEGGSTAVRLDALDAVRAKIGPAPSPAELLTALRGRPGWERLHSVRALAMALNPLGIVRRQLWNHGVRRWGYVLDPERLADLRARYVCSDLPSGDSSGEAMRPRMNRGASSHHRMNGRNGGGTGRQAEPGKTSAGQRRRIAGAARAGVRQGWARGAVSGSGPMAAGRA